MSDNARFPITEAQIVGLFLESIFYGTFLASFGLCMYYFFRPSKRYQMAGGKIHWPMCLVAVIMCIVATVDVAVGLQHVIYSFVDYSGPGGAQGRLTRLSSWPNIVKAVDYVIQTAVGDGVLIWRCYRVYDKNWKIVVLPIILWLATLAAGVRTVWVEVITDHDALLNDPHLKPWITSLAACTLVLNVIVTSLIVLRIWRVTSTVASISQQKRRFTRAIHIVLDSGLVYTTAMIIFFATVLAGSNAQYGVSDVIVQVIGITFNTILIRVLTGWAIGEQDDTDAHTVDIRFVDSALTRSTLCAPTNTDISAGTTTHVCQRGSISATSTDSQPQSVKFSSSSSSSDSSV